MKVPAFRFNKATSKRRNYYHWDNYGLRVREGPRLAHLVFAATLAFTIPDVATVARVKPGDEWVECPLLAHNSPTQGRPATMRFSIKPLDNPVCLGLRGACPNQLSTDSVLCAFDSSRQRAPWPAHRIEQWVPLRHDLPGRQQQPGHCV